jgi:CubicO group peptidase (beta-lactamase class C family)
MQTIDEDIQYTLGKPEDVGLDSKILDSAFGELIRIFPNVYSLLIVKDAQLVFERYHGHARRNHAFSIKSITKSIMNSLVGIAVRNGIITSVDQYITDILKDFPSEVLRNLHGVSIRHLLTMTHGIEVSENSPEMLEVWNSPNWLQAIMDLPLTKKPGQSFHYSTVSTHLLSAILTYVSRVPASYYASRMLFWPLGIPIPVYWESDPQGINWGGTNMFLTPRILARFGQLYLADGVWNGQRILPSKWVTESFSKQSDGWTNYADYGYLWWISSFKDIHYAFGSGYGGQYLYVIPELQCVIVLTANSDIAIAEMQSTSNIVVKDPSYILNSFLENKGH